jgi:hypothetical protein
MHHGAGTAVRLKLPAATSVACWGEETHNPGQQSTPLCLILSLKFFHPLVLAPRLRRLFHCIEVTFHSARVGSMTESDRLVLLFENRCLALSHDPDRKRSERVLRRFGPRQKDRNREQMLLRLPNRVTSR